MIMIPTMIDGSLLLYAFARGREGDRRPARSCFRAGSDWSTPLLTPFAPATWPDRSLLILTFFYPSYLPSSLHLCTLASVHFSFQPFRRPSLSSSRLRPSSFPSHPLPFNFRSFSHGLPVRFLHPLLLFCTPFSPPVLTFKREIWRLYRTSLGRVFYLARPSITSYAIRMKKNNCYIRCSPGGCVNTFYSWRAAAWFDDLLFSSRHTRRDASNLSHRWARLSFLNLWEIGLSKFVYLCLSPSTKKLYIKITKKSQHARNKLRLSAQIDVNIDRNFHPDGNKNSRSGDSRASSCPKIS